MTRGVRTRRVVAALGAASVTLALAGCSQVAAIAPVGGDRLAEVRYAANDVLLEEGIDILTAPVCTSPDEIAVTCEGETMDGEVIRVESTAEAQDDVVVTVGDRTLYDGSLLDVLDRGSSG
ncbi:hypothetical protein ABXJ56_02425 [Microbacterium chocolatum]|uniref:hypothetical protein n=1 Tax=Microbacterium aurantiacum TaxID=162393 RepID=UPI00338E85D8